MRLCLAIAALATPTVAGAELRLALPLACTLGTDCYIQQYVDADPGPGATDFTCGPLSYDGHKGTDFALPSLAGLANGVAVLAAAPGVVAGLRDGMPDALQTGEASPDVEGRECGNGVVIDHGGGWQTQYCHMEMGSIVVAEGQSVAAGDVLGRVGLSGQTQFPHLHLSLRRDGAVVDPFDPEDSASCGPAADTLWIAPPGYTPGGLLQAGLATGVPEFEAIKAGLPPATLARDAPLVLWGHLFGGREGDVVRIVITGPAGEVIAHDEPLTRTQAQLFRAAGRRAPPGGWPPGDYAGAVHLIRGGTVISSIETAGRID